MYDKSNEAQATILHHQIYLVLTQQNLVRMSMYKTFAVYYAPPHQLLIYNNRILSTARRLRTPTPATTHS